MLNTIHKRDGFAGQKLFVLSEQVLGTLATHPLIRQCYVTDIGYFPSAKYHFRDRPAGSTSHIIIVCVDGLGWVETESMGRKRITKGNWFLVPAHTAHTYSADEHHPWSIYWFHFDGEQADELVGYLQEDFPPLSPIPLTPEFQRRFVTLFEEVSLTMERGITIHRMIYASYAARHMLALLRYASELVMQSSQQNQIVERTLVFMQERIHDTVTLEDLSKNVGLSKTQFTHLFREDTGRTPINYFLHLKMQRACQYLDSTDWSIKQIAISLKIEDPYYFSRMFHKLMGVSPTDYRQHKRG